MSSLWTPSGSGDGSTTSGAAGEDRPGTPPSAAEQAEREEELRRVHAELTATPAARIVANHAVGLWQLAILHLASGEGAVPDLGEAGLAIDAMAALVEGLGDRLGDSAPALTDALAQLRLAFVQRSAQVGAEPSAPDATAGAEATPQ